jgi:Uma2 family endonuclease
MAAQPHPLTAEEFAALPREGLRLELVRGELRAMPPAFSDHGYTAMQLGTLLGHYILANGLGRIYAAETGFLLARNPDTVRAPDFAFIQASRVTPEVTAPNGIQ